MTKACNFTLITFVAINDNIKYMSLFSLPFGIFTNLSVKLMQLYILVVYQHLQMLYSHINYTIFLHNYPTYLLIHKHLKLQKLYF